MKEVKGDLFQFQGDAICITTNMYAPRGELVMGAGVALQAKRLHPELPKCWGGWGTSISQPPVQVQGFSYRWVVGFPTKVKVLVYPRPDQLLPAYQNKAGEREVPGWMGRSALATVEISLKALLDYTKTFEWSRVALTRPGCGNGGLKWEEVRPLLESYLDDRFYIYS